MSRQKVHELKTLHDFFQAIWEERKGFEIRENDRHFKVHDYVRLREFIPSTGYTGREILAKIIYLTDFKQKWNYVVFGIKGITRKSPPK